MVLGKPAPFVRAFVDAVDAAIRMHQPHHAMSVTQRTWLAFCITAVLVTHSMCWARFARASLGTYAMAALSWMVRHSKMPWEHLLVARVRVILQHHGITSGSLIVDDTDNPRSKAAKALAYLYKLRDKARGGYLWGQSLVFFVLVTPKISLPVGVVFYQPAPELSAWYKTAKALKKRGSLQPSDRANPHLTHSIPPKNNSPCAYWRPSRPNMARSGFTLSWRMRSMAQRLLSMGPRLFSMVYKCSHKSAAISICGSASVTNTWLTTLLPIPGHHTASASEAVRR
jgi:hypothetical protein